MKKAHLLPCARLANILFTYALGAALLTAVGCSPAAIPALKQAQANYRQAQHDPQILTYAPVTLHEAGQSLYQAERIWDSTRNREETEHLAELADRRVEFARTIAQKNKTEAEVRRLQQEREMALLEAYIRKAEQAKEQAEQAKQAAEARAREAEQAHEQARRSAIELERARQGEATRAREAALARQQAEREAEAAVMRAQRLEQQLTELKTLLSGFLAAAARGR
ncbi:MAG: DUF4398 domain-containing protein [Candidatus Binatia bacterium]